MGRFITMAGGAFAVGFGAAIIAALVLLSGLYAFYALTTLNLLALGLFAILGALALGSIAAFKRLIVPFARSAFAGETDA